MTKKIEAICRGAKLNDVKMRCSLDRRIISLSPRPGRHAGLCLSGGRVLSVDLASRAAQYVLSVTTLKRRQYHTRLLNRNLATD